LLFIFFLGASSFFTWFATLRGLGFNTFIVVAFKDFVEAKNSIGFVGAKLFVKGYDREEKLVDGKFTSCKTMTNHLTLKRTTNSSYQ